MFQGPSLTFLANLTQLPTLSCYLQKRKLKREEERERKGETEKDRDREEAKAYIIRFLYYIKL